MIGQTIDNRYHIENLLGKGGMGAVYRATDLIEKRPVALKLLHYYIDIKTDRALTRFHREFRVLARLDHPNIVRAYAYGNYNEVPYLVLEFLEGRTLSEEGDIIEYIANHAPPDLRSSFLALPNVRAVSPA